jgi:hypothetical protein
MKYLTTHNLASVAILYPACRWLSDRDEVSYGDMARSMRPSSLVSGKDDALRASLTVARDIGLLNSPAEFRADTLTVRCQLSELTRSQRDRWYSDPVKFRALVRSALLAKAVDDIASNQTPSDVAVGLAWLLAQDPARPPALAHRAGPGVALAAQKLDSFVGTEEQWRALLRWAQALGCATVASSSSQARRFVLPDPTNAIREELPAIRPDGLTAAEFREALVQSLPVLDGGSISDYMRSVRAPSADPWGDAMAGPAFSFALRRLQNRHVIRLLPEADATYRVTCVLHGERWAFDRVTYPAGSHDD